jgi:Apea-like HEPN
LLISALITGELGKFHHEQEPRWTLIWNGTNIENQLLHQGFALGEGGIQEDFGKTSEKFVPTFDGPDYFRRLWMQEDQIILPPNLNHLLEIFQFLTIEMQDKFLRACYWLSLGIENRSITAMSIIAFSTAIKCLLPKNSILKCDSCGQAAKGEGVSKQFKEHVEKYGEIAELPTELVAALYNVRSDMVHGNRNSIVDTDWSSLQCDSDRTSSMLLSFLAKRCIVNWLAGQATSQ